MPLKAFLLNFVITLQKPNKVGRLLDQVKLFFVFLLGFFSFLFFSLIYYIYPNVRIYD